MTDDPQVTVEVANRVATLRMNRPEQMNTWQPEMEAEMRAALMAAEADDDVRAIIVTGSGRAFCAGASLQTLAKRADGQAMAPVRERRDGDLDQRYSYMLGLTKPLIAAINGATAGVGFCLALYCDIRFMAAGARMSTAFARRGLVAEHASAWMLQRQIGPMNAADLLLSARRIDGEEAARLGFARCLPDDGFLEAVQAYAGDMANLCSPRSLRLIKQQLWESQDQSLTEATHWSEDEINKCRQTEDYREGSAHFLEKRAPQFTGL